ncbi:uncharacterized protein [Procambarus clarkii]|uniref:uncharacterized protein n=1 Tax=Procambarus clarkii TaxID=6728 RepID=UPI003742B988
MCNDYDALKRVLMKGYGISTDGMMRALRQIRVRQGKTYRAMLQRLESSLKRYFELNNAVVPEDNTLFELMTREQFLEAVEPALRAKLKENEMAECADRWAESHRPRQGGSSENRRHDQASGSGARPKESKSRVSHKPHKVSGPRCFTCGQPGHKAAQCKKGRRAEKGETHAQIAGLGAHEGGDPLEHTLETARGLVNGKWTKVFRDRGATTHMVRESLVEPGNETGRTIHVRYPDGTQIDKIEVSLIVDTPYVKGKIRAVKCKDAVYGLLLGNAPGVSNSKSRSCGSDSQRTGPTPAGGDVTRQSAGSQAIAASPAKELRQQAQGKRGKPAPFRQQKTGRNSRRWVGARSADPARPRQPRGWARVTASEVHKRRGGKPLVTVGVTAAPRGNKALVAAVTTRATSAQPTKVVKPLKLHSLKGVSAKEFQEAQRRDPTLRKMREHAAEGRVFTMNKRRYKYLEVKGKLVRRVETPQDTWEQLLVPKEHRLAVFTLGHEGVMGGHMGHAKTSERIQSSFYWPGMTGDVQRYTRSCDASQRTADRGKVQPGKLKPFPIIDQPFKMVSVDIIGPIEPRASDGSRYILTMVDHATRYPEAAPLKNIETVTVAEALVGFFSRLGIPEKIHSDRGAQFTSEMMAEVARLLMLQPSFTTSYHAMGNGLVERFNGTLKRMLRKMCIEQPKEWPRYINPLLFAYREVPQASTRFTPFNLLYGRTVKGPLHVLKNLWEGEDCTPETKTTYEYVIDLRNRLEETCKLARKELAKAKEYQKSRYDQKARERKFKVGDKVLLLLPTSRNKLLLQWKGPFTITECIHSLTYVVCVRGVNKKYHVNMLKRYEERDDASSRSEESENSASPGSPSQGVAGVSGMTQTEAGAAELGVQPSFEASSRLEPGPGAEHSAPKSGNTTQDELEESPQVSQGDDA